MRRVSRIERRQSLNGWIKWVFIPIVLFSVLFADAWLNVQVRHKDYVLTRLNVERRELEREFNKTAADRARLTGMDHHMTKASEYGLGSPETRQFKHVAYREPSRRIQVMQPTATTFVTPGSGTFGQSEVSGVALARNVVALPPSPKKSEHKPDRVDEQVLLTPIAPARPLDTQYDVLPGLNADMGVPAYSGLAQASDTDESILTLEDMLGTL